MTVAQAKMTRNPSDDLDDTPTDSEPPKAHRLVRFSIVAVATALLAGAVVFSAAPAQVSTATTSRGPRLVRTMMVDAPMATRPVQAYGVVQAADRVVLSFTQPGRLIERKVQVGDQVHSGDSLARLDAQAYATASQAAAASVREADSALEQLRRDATRVETLRRGGAASDADLEKTRSAKARVEASSEAARAQLSEARRRLRETHIKAPFDGVVTFVGAEVGEVVAAGTPMVILTGSGGREIEILLPETVASVLEVGTEVGIELPLLGRKDLHGSVHAVALAGSRVGSLFPAIVQLDDAQDVLPGAAATLRFEIPTGAEGVSIPLAGVTSPSGSRPTAFVVRDSKAKQVPITLGELIGDRIIVQGPLEEGETIVVAGHVGLRDGETVQMHDGDAR